MVFLRKQLARGFSLIFGLLIINPQIEHLKQHMHNVNKAATLIKISKFNIILNFSIQTLKYFLAKVGDISGVNYLYIL